MSTTIARPTKDTTQPTPQEFCDKHNACSEGRDFALTKKTMADVWENCPNVPWLIWIMQRLGQEADRKNLRLFACWCVRETPLGNGRKVWDLLTDERSRNAVVVAERFANGEASEAELDAARAAAWAAARDAGWDAARAAAGAAGWAAGAAAQKFQADHFRTIFPNPFK